MTAEEAIKTVSSDYEFCGSEERTAIDMAINALEKQIPQAPVPAGDGYDDGEMIYYDEWCCPNCDKQYDTDGIYGVWKYCPNCGQAICWDEQEESGE